MIIIVAVLVFIFHLLFLSGNEKFDFMPYSIGSLTVLSIYFVKNVGKEAEEWDGSYTGTANSSLINNRKKK